MQVFIPLPALLMSNDLSRVDADSFVSIDMPRKKRKVFPGRRELWEALDEPKVSRPLGVQLRWAGGGGGGGAPH